MTHSKAKHIKRIYHGQKSWTGQSGLKHPGEQHKGGCSSLLHALVLPLRVGFVSRLTHTLYWDPYGRLFTMVSQRDSKSASHSITTASNCVWLQPSPNCTLVWRRFPLHPTQHCYCCTGTRDSREGRQGWQSLAIHTHLFSSMMHTKNLAFTDSGFKLQKLLNTNTPHCLL